MYKKSLIAGSLCALISAAAFALNLVLAGMSYEYGVNVHASNLARALLFFIFLGSYILSTGASFQLPSKVRWLSLLVGILLCTEMYVLLGAIITIPVALAVLIFYTYPILIASIKWIRQEEQFSWLSLVLMITGFSGLVFVLLNAPPAQLSSTGIILSAIAAFVMAAMLITSEKSLANHDDQVVLFHSLGIVVAIIFIASIVLVDLSWPSGEIGWLVFLGSAIFYTLATFTLFKAVSLVGPLRTAIIDNTAPVWAIIFGYFLLSQSFSIKQTIGAIVVVAAVMLLQITNKQTLTED